MLDAKWLTFYDQVVDRLIKQYREYQFLMASITELENQHVQEIARLAKAKNLTLRAASKVAVEFESVKSLEDRIALLRADQQRVSDEMTFPNHYVWMRYKDRAYKGSNTEIAILGDFRRHCAPDKYICTRRFNFLGRYLKEFRGTDLSDRVKYPDSMKLADFYASPEILRLLDEVEFLKMWKQNEYLICGDQINKWQTAA